MSAQDNGQQHLWPGTNQPTARQPLATTLAGPEGRVHAKGCLAYLATLASNTSQEEAHLLAEPVLLLLLLEGPEGPDPLLLLAPLVPATLTSLLSVLSPGSPEGAEVGPEGLLGDGSEGSSSPDSVEAGRAMVMVSASCHMHAQCQLVCSQASASGLPAAPRQNHLGKLG